MAASLSGIFEEGLRSKIAESRVLVVGAGGIGCEILKNLVLCGFADIELVDLDTIDVSNLNRQFLFHKDHVGKSKAEVARLSALRFNPKVSITAHHDSIMANKYGNTFFKDFNIVLNALDNRQARNHVNRMCLSANVPLIESGTAGYNGQVEFIKKGLTQCYECQPKAAQKTYPGCTIRNTPSEPIHCVIWAKHLFNQLFGESLEDEDVSPDQYDPEEGAVKSGEDVQRLNTRLWAQSCNYDQQKLFNKLFYEDIKYLLSMKNLWKTRQPPQPLKWEDVTGDELQHSNSSELLPDQVIWSVTECEKVFRRSLQSISDEYHKLEKGDHLVWDKDSKHHMDFVAACANIRAIIFHISQKSRFDIKSMAGNIIPAIATTNAITAGIVVMHAFKVLLSQFEKCQSVYIRLRPNARNQLLIPDRVLSSPNPKCYVCSTKPEVVLKVDTEKLTVKHFRDDVLIKTLNMVNPDATISGKGLIVISSEEGETDGINDKTLNMLGIVDGTILDIDDFFQEYNLSVTINHMEAQINEPVFEVVAGLDSLKPTANGGVNGDGSSVNGTQTMDSDHDRGDLKTKSSESNKNDDDDLIIMDEEDSSTVSPPPKRKHNGGEGPSSFKRMKIYEERGQDDALMIIDE